LHMLGCGYSPGDVYTCAEARVLTALNCPISLSKASYRADQDADLCMVASIPSLVLLDIHVENFSDRVAEVFSVHGALAELHLVGRSPIAISDEAIRAITRIPTLRTLYLGGKQDDFSAQAIAAFAENSTIETLRLGGIQQPCNAAASMAMSRNSTVTSLQIALTDGCGHLAHMPNLQHLTLCGSAIDVANARQFEQDAELKTLDISGVRFEAGAFAFMAGSAVDNLKISLELLTAQDVEALLANRRLHSLHCVASPYFASTVSHSIALAAHPTLSSLCILHTDDPWLRWNEDTYRVEESGPMPRMTVGERSALFAAWGSNRASSRLTVNF